MIDYILFDLDNTLYPQESGILKKIDRRIDLFLMEKLEEPLETVDKIRQIYRNKYGTTLQGVKIHFNIEPMEYIEYVHNFEPSEILSPSIELQKMLERMAAKKSIFTNSPESHAQRVLKALGVENHYEHIFDILYFNYEGKPNVSAYEKVLSHIDVPAKNCIMIDDWESNLETAKGLGMTTVLIGAKELSYVDYCIDNILELENLLC